MRIFGWRAGILSAVCFSSLTLSANDARYFVMRLDDNHTPAQWRQVADAFERHGLRACFAVTAVSLSDEQGACLAELSRRGHEIMDHTPQHAIYRQEFRDDASFAARTNRPYVAEWDAARRHIYCRAEIDWEHRSAFRFKGSIRDGEVVVTDPAALKRLHFTAKFYVPSVKRWFGVRTAEGDRRQIADFWGRDVKDVVVPETEMVTLFQDAIQPSDQLLRDQCQTTRTVFDRFGIARPTCWIQPGGWESFLDWKVLKRVCGGEFGYVAADAVVGPATGSNAWVLRPNFAYFDEGYTFEEVTKRVTSALDKGRFFIYISHMNGSRIGGWEKWLAETEAFAAWLEKSGITVVTYSDLARRLFPKETK